MFVVIWKQNKPKTDKSAVEERNGKDIQGIPWERLNFTREKYRETRLRQYKNYANLSGSREEMEKECLQVEKGQAIYDFQFNTRLVKSTIVHFQLRNLLWATWKHDVYFMQNYSVMHWSSLLRTGKEVLNVAKPIVPCLKRPGLLSQQLSRVQISTMAVKENLMVAGGFQGELICKYLNQPGVAFCTKLTTDDNAITNAVDVYHTSSGAMRVVAANNDAQIRIFDAETFASLNRFLFDWSVNKRPGLLSQQLSRVQISTMAVKENLMVAGGFQGELICKYLNQPGVAFCTKLTTDDNAITNAVDVYHTSSGAMRVVAANNDAQIRIFDAETFASLNRFLFDWSVNNTSVSPDGK
ncbi:hypothetical protein CRYUN_Cryun35bG0059400 [Craigia yunnanensis]